MEAENNKTARKKGLAFTENKYNEGLSDKIRALAEKRKQPLARLLTEIFEAYLKENKD